MAHRVGVLTVSDAGARGERVDVSGDVVVEWATRRGDAVAERALVPDDVGRIVPILIEWIDSGRVDVVITTGGTGLTARDVTPEATRVVIEREAPGIAEAIRAAGAAKVATAMLSRGLAGTRGATLVVNLPGSPGGVRDGLAVLDPVIDHAIALVTGTAVDHGAGGARG